MIENEVKNWLTNEMSLDVNDIEHKLLQLSSNDKNLICEFILKCVSICKSYNTESTSMNRDFHSHPQVKVFTELFSAIEENMEVSESKVVLDSIRQAFSHFAVGGLLQLYKRQENEVWYPKVALRSILTPNDIHLLPDVVEVYRGCDITEYHLKKFNQALLSDLKNYFKKIVKANDKLKKVDSGSLRRVLGRRWLYNFICHKEFNAIFSKYFWYGVASVIGRRGYNLC